MASPSVPVGDATPRVASFAHDIHVLNQRITVQPFNVGKRTVHQRRRRQYAAETATGHGDFRLQPWLNQGQPCDTKPVIRRWLKVGKWRLVPVKTHQAKGKVNANPCGGLETRMSKAETESEYAAIRSLRCFVVSTPVGSNPLAC